MDGEMYVILLTISSSKARAVAARVFGVEEPNNLLRKLHAPEAVFELASRLGCSKSEAFSKLAELMRAAFERHALVTFSRFHLNLLLENRTKTALGRLLRCRSDDAIRNLFEPGAMRNTLSKITSKQAQQLRPDADILLRAIIASPNPDSIEQLYGGERDWGIILQSENWLLPGAIRRLEIEALGRNWPSNDMTRVLANYVDKPVGD